MIPDLLPEVILATKEANEKAREMAYNLLLAIAHRMEQGGKFAVDFSDEELEREEKAKGKGKEKEGGKVKEKAKESDMETEKEGQKAFTEASLEEFFKMVVAGLAGSSQHMTSATVNCLSRLVFEFHGFYYFLQIPFDLILFVFS